MYDDIIFMYELMTVWGTICETVVSETDSGVVISFTDEKNRRKFQLIQMLWSESKYHCRT